ncbi:MAG: glycerophosphodiester phosphodiesterase [Terriglobales bacterium]
MSGCPPLLLGHRGTRVSDTAAENTLAAFDLALELGCNGFEFDVRRTACGTSVICHDEKVQGVKVAEAGCGQLQSVPRLDDVLGRYVGRAFLDIELKVPGLESDVLMALHEHPPECGYVVSSFLPEVLLELRTRSATVTLGFICDRKKALDRWPELPVEYVIPKHTLVTARLVQAVHDAGKTMLTWTVNDKKKMQRLAKWEVDGIIADDPGLLARTLRA